MDTEGGGASDVLDTIAVSNGIQDGHVIILRPVSSSRSVRLTALDNINVMGGQCFLSRSTMHLVLRYRAATNDWYEIARSAPQALQGPPLPISAENLPVSSNTIMVSASRHRVDTSTGPQTVQTIDGGLYPGHMLLLSPGSSSNALTVTTDDNVVLANGATFISSSANDRLQLEWSGAKWCEISRSINS